MQEAANDVALRKALTVRLPQAAMHLAALQTPVRVAVLVVSYLTASKPRHMSCAHRSFITMP